MKWYDGKEIFPFINGAYTALINGKPKRIAFIDGKWVYKNKKGILYPINPPEWWTYDPIEISVFFSTI